MKCLQNMMTYGLGSRVSGSVSMDLRCQMLSNIIGK